MNKKKSLLFITGMLIIMLLLSSCLNGQEDVKKEDTKVEYETSEKYISFDEAIKLSDLGILGEFVKFHDKEEYVQYEFKVKNIIFGNISEESILVNSTKSISTVDDINYQYFKGENIYDVGKEYILILNRSDILFNEKARYSFMTDIFIPYEETDKANMYGESINVGGNLIDHITTLTNDIQYPYSQEIKYFEGEELSTVVQECDIIVEVYVKGMIAEGVQHNGNTYSCELKNVLKGESVQSTEDNEIFVVAIKNSITIGSNYVILLNKISDSSTIYSQASPNGIISIEDIAQIENIKEGIE